jgi:hypothetical protein
MNCYGWSAEFFEKAATDYDRAVRALKTRETLIMLRNIALNVLSATNAQMQAELKARQMAELRALAHPGQMGVGYGYGSSPVIPLGKGSQKYSIQTYTAEAEKCRQTSIACRDIIQCYSTKQSSLSQMQSCAVSAGENIQYLR